jgi:hypothetical protein
VRRGRLLVQARASNPKVVFIPSFLPEDQFTLVQKECRKLK